LLFGKVKAYRNGANFLGHPVGYYYTLMSTERTLAEVSNYGCFLLLLAVIVQY